MSWTQENLAALIAKASQHPLVRKFTVREANLATVIEQGIASNVTNIPNSALAGTDTTTVGAGKLQQCAVATYSFAALGGAIGTVSLGVALPSGALVTKVMSEIVTAPTSSGSNGTIQLTLPTDGQIGTNITANGSAANADISATPLKKATAVRNISVTIGTSAITAGVVKFYVLYVQSV